jgi:hypothetical protein
MRNISTGSLLKLAQKIGTEPIYVVEVGWEAGTKLYADKAFPQYNVEGKILNLGKIQNIASFTDIGSGQTVDVILNDTDGSLKTTFNNTDIHQKPVWVWLWFNGTLFSEKILLFKGIIASPIEWSEGERTLKFDIINNIDIQEVGFSLEEGQFLDLPAELVGVAWPLIFGTVAKVPGILLDQIPESNKTGTAADSILKEPLGVRDPTLDYQITKTDNTKANAMTLAMANFLAYLLASHTAEELGEFKPPSEGPEDGTGQYSRLAIQFKDAGNKLLAEVSNISEHSNTLKAKRQNQKAFEKKEVGVTNGSIFPQGVPLKLNIKGALISGYFVGDKFVISDLKHPDYQRTIGLSEIIQSQKDNENERNNINRSSMLFINGGTRIGLASDSAIAANYTPIRYVICLGNCTVLAAYAYRNIDGYKILSPIPSSYYGIYLINFGSITASVAYFSQPLSTRDEGWENEVYFTVTSALSNNVADAMIYIIQNYTNLSYDPISFDKVRNSTVNYPVNFAVLDRPNALTLLHDMAYQSRCALWIKSDTLYVKYLPSEDDSVDTITEADLIFSTAVVSTTETEEIITKYTAEWKADYLQSKAYKIILRYNIIKYGVKEKSFNYYIFNQEALVEVGAIFWLIRSANTFKKITFRTALSKLKLEPFDTITLNFTNNYVSLGPISGCIIEEANIDVDNYEIEFIVWVPVRLGEMVKYDFAYPADLSIQTIYPTDKDVNAGVVGSTGSGKDSKLPSQLQTGDPIALKNQIKRDPGNGGSRQTFYRRSQLEPRDYGSFAGGDNNFSSVGNISTRIEGDDIEVTDQPSDNQINNYQYKDFDLKIVPKQTAVAANASLVPAKIIEGSENNYTVNAYYKGLANEPTVIKDVMLLGANDTDNPVQPDTPGYVTQLTFTNGDQVVTEYYIYVAVWG